MRLTRIIIMLAIFIVLFSVSVSAKEFYFNQTGGSDSNNCSTTYTACKTIAKVNTIGFNASDKIYFNRGDTWRFPTDAWFKYRNGSAVGSVTYGAYGVGDKPKFLGSINGSNASNWTDTGANRWRFSSIIPIQVGNVIYNDGTFAVNRSDINTSLDLQGEFLWNATTLYLYVYSTSNPATIYTNIEIALGNESGHYAGANLDDASFLTIRDIDYRYFGWAAITGQDQKNVSVINNDISWCGGIYESGTSGLRYGDCIGGALTVSNIVVYNNTIQHSLDAGITYQTWLTDSAQNIINITITNNIINESGYGMVFFSSNRSSKLYNWLIDHNTIINSGKITWGNVWGGRGIRFGTMPDNTSYVNITNNIFYNYNSLGIDVGDDTTTRWRGTTPYIDYNLYTGGTTNIVSYNATEYATVNAFYSGKGLEEHGYNGSISFVSGTFQPNASSPACTMSSTGSYVGALPCASSGSTPTSENQTYLYYADDFEYDTSQLESHGWYCPTNITGTSSDYATNNTRSMFNNPHEIDDYNQYNCSYPSDAITLGQQKYYRLRQNFSNAIPYKYRHENNTWEIKYSLIIPRSNTYDNRDKVYLKNGTPILQIGNTGDVGADWSVSFYLFANKTWIDTDILLNKSVNITYGYNGSAIYINVSNNTNSFYYIWNTTEKLGELGETWRYSATIDWLPTTFYAYYDMYTVKYWVNVTNPATITLISPVSITQNLAEVNFTFSVDFNMTNCSLFTNTSTTWKANQTLLNITENQINTFQMNLTNISSDYIWNVRCFDNASSEFWAATNATVYINTIFNISNIATSYNNLTLSTKSETFYINFTMPTFPYTISSVSLSYNNTLYSATLNQNSENYSAYRTITIPSVSVTQNMTFFWVLTRTLDGLQYNTTITNQSVFIYAVDNCTNALNITTNATAINFTGVYENNQSTVNISITSGSTIVYQATGTTAESTIYISAINVPFYQICMYPNWTTFSVDYNINYNKFGDTTTRSRADTITISKTLTTIPLYVLATDTGTAAIISFQIRDAGTGNPIEGASVTATRNILGTDYTVQSESSDAAGMAYLYLDTLQYYTITASKSGYGVLTKLIKPTSGQIYYIDLVATTTSQKSDYEGISYYFTPSETMLINNTYYNFSFNLSSTYWQITYCNFTLKNDTNVLSTIVGSYNDSRCGATILYNSGLQTAIYSEAQYILNNSKTFIQTYKYEGVTWSQGQYSFKTVIDDITNFSGAGFDWKARMLLAFIIIFIIVGFVSWQFNALINPEPSLWFLLSLVLVFSIIGWLAVPTTFLNMPDWGNGFLNPARYVIFVLISLVVGGYLMWRHSS